MIIETTSSKLNGYVGFSFFIWIWIAKDGRNPKRTINHETIHFWQQVEMLFVLMWLLYILSYLWNIVKYKGKHDKAYRNIPFEKEAYANDDNLDYLKSRKMFSWVKYF